MKKFFNKIFAQLLDDAYYEGQKLSKIIPLLFVKCIIDPCFNFFKEIKNIYKQGKKILTEKKKPEDLGLVEGVIELLIIMIIGATILITSPVRHAYRYVKERYLIYKIYKVNCKNNR